MKTNVLNPDAVFDGVIIDFISHYPISVQRVVKIAETSQIKNSAKNTSFLNILAYPFIKIIEWL